MYPPEEVCSRQAMRTPGKQPRILLTNVKQLELLLTRQQDFELFSGARLDYLVFDEAHTFTGAMGAESACLIRRLRSFCNVDPGHTTCVATSATIVDPNEPNAARNFAARFFGVPSSEVVTVGEDYEIEAWREDRFAPPVPKGDPSAILERCVAAVGEDQGSISALDAAYMSLSDSSLSVTDASEWPRALYAGLSRNELVFRLNEALDRPRPLKELPGELQKHLGRPVTEAEILAWLTLGAAAREGERPLLRPVIHGFVRGIGGAVVSFPADKKGARLWLTANDSRSDGPNKDHMHLPVTTCTVCGQHYYIAFLKDFSFDTKQPGGGEAVADGHYWGTTRRGKWGQALGARRPIDRRVGPRGRANRIFMDGSAPLLPPLRGCTPDSNGPLPLLWAFWCHNRTSSCQAECQASGKADSLSLMRL